MVVEWTIHTYVESTITLCPVPWDSTAWWVWSPHQLCHLTRASQAVTYLQEKRLKLFALIGNAIAPSCPPQLSSLRLPHTSLHGMQHLLVFVSDFLLCGCLGMEGAALDLLRFHMVASKSKEHWRVLSKMWDWQILGRTSGDRRPFFPPIAL